MIKLLSTCFAFLLSFSLFAQVETETSLITFGLDEDHLSAFAKTQLAEIAEDAQSADVYRVELFGHTDQQGERPVSYITLTLPTLFRLLFPSQVKRSHVS